MYVASNAWRAAFVALAAAIAMTSVSPSAHADDEEEARAAMRRGVAAFGRGEAEAALLEYEAAKKLAPAANAPYRYAAEALLALGRAKEAVENLESYLAKNPGVSDQADVRQRIATIRAERYPARLTVRVDAPDAIVTIDDQDRGAPGTYELAPGKHRVTVRAPGRSPMGEDVTLVGDRESSIVIAPPREVAPPPAGEPRRDASEDRSAFPWRPAGWITLGVGAATFVTMAVVDAAVLGPKVKDYQDAADRGDVGARQLRNDASGLRTGLLIGYVVGGVLAAGGGAMILFAPTSSSSRAQVVPTWTPGSAGLTTRVAF